MNCITVAVIASSLPDDLTDSISKSDYRRMCGALNSVLRFLRKEGRTNVITLVSGGSAPEEHTAVSLFLSGGCEKLELFLPDEFLTDSSGRRRFAGCERGGSLHTRHIRFSDTCEIGSLKELSDAMSREQCGVTSFSGVSSRNTALIASVPEYAIVFGYERTEELLLYPKDKCKWCPSGSTGRVWRALWKTGTILLYIPIKRRED